jgi:hypothetical protein
MPCFCWTYLDDDTIRTWHRLYREEGIEGLASLGHEGSACRLSDVQQDKLTAWITETLPRTTREVGAWIETECGITYESRSGLIALCTVWAWNIASRKQCRLSWTPTSRRLLSKRMKISSTSLGMTRPSYLAMRCIGRSNAAHPGRSRCSSTER